MNTGRKEAFLGMTPAQCPTICGMTNKERIRNQASDLLTKQGGLCVVKIID